jgi:hypothetical protein
VVTEHLQAAHGHEAAEVGEQPDALVVDAHVEVDRRKAIVLQVDEDRERHDPQGDPGPECRFRDAVVVPGLPTVTRGRLLPSRLRDWSVSGCGLHAPAWSHSAGGARCQAVRRYH